MISSDLKVVSKCLDSLRFWISSIVMHTSSIDNPEPAPIALIGTREVSSPLDHQRISTILYETFSRSIAWGSMIEYDTAVGVNGRTTLNFFPVDNVSGRKDPSVIDCMKIIENTIDSSTYVHQEQPLVYLQTLDKLTSVKETFLKFDDVIAISGQCGVPIANVKHMLTLFHEMGMLMFHGIIFNVVFKVFISYNCTGIDEPGLSDVVILDPINFLVQPVTKIICKVTTYVVVSMLKCKMFVVCMVLACPYA